MILEKIVPPVEIATERFSLRPVRKSDAGLFALYAGDKRVAEATQGIPHPLPPGVAEAFCARAMTAGTEEDIWVMDGRFYFDSGTGLWQPQPADPSR